VPAGNLLFMTILNAFTVDVEDYFQVSAFENVVCRSQWDQWESRVVANTHRILRLLDRHQVAATFFVLGWVADHHPQLVRDIQSAGHEIGAHGYWHHLIYQQSPEEFRSELRLSREVIEDAIGRRVTAFRAPSFSITRRSLWALEILAEEGFEFDSSIFPIRHDRYGIPDAKTSIHKIETRSGPLWEFPATVAKVGCLRMPVGGGGYFRLYPLAGTVHWLARINRTGRKPFMFYVHPCELDPEQPRIRASSRLSRFRHYVNLSTNESKLAAILQRFRFGKLSDAVEYQHVA
jgi:polysaccharide deacetylase family protein (PEP-CTERM system associated)